MTSGEGTSTVGVVVATFGISNWIGTGDGDFCAQDSETTGSGDPGDSFGFEGFGLEGLGLFTAADAAAVTPSTIGEGGADML